MDLNLIFQTIGTIASISSIPIAVIIFQKQKKSVFEDTKKSILNKISCIVADENEITSIEVLSIIKSTLRSSNIKENKVLATEIIEDMIAEVISNPLLDSKRKVDINNNLKKVMAEFMVVTNLTSMKDEQKNEYISKMINDNNANITEENNKIINRVNNEQLLNVKINRIKKIKDSISAFIAIAISILTSLISGYLLMMNPSKISDIVSININWLVIISSCFAIISIVYVVFIYKKKT